MDVAHVQLASICLGVSIAVEKVNSAVGRLLVLVLDDRFNFPGMGRVGAPLAVVISGFNEMPQMVDDAG